MSDLERHWLRLDGMRELRDTAVEVVEDPEDVIGNPQRTRAGPRVSATPPSSGRDRSSRRVRSAPEGAPVAPLSCVTAFSERVKNTEQ
jgi:hypothetical protein